MTGTLRDRRGGRGRLLPGSALAALLIVVVEALAIAAACDAQETDSSATPNDIPMPPMFAPPRLGGYIQVRSVGQKQVGLTTFLNRARFSIDGLLPSRFSYRFLAELQASAGARLPATVSLREAIIRWNPAPFAITGASSRRPSAANT